jgi:predicted nucleic acid-binding protein
MYLDSCVLAKLFIIEPDSEACLAKVSGSVIVSSELAYGELFSTLLRKQRAGELSGAQRKALWADFERQVAAESIYLAVLDGVIARQAKDVMLEVHPHVPLRTLDAIHLATYQSVLAGPLFTMDKRMRDAARLLEIPLID